MLAPDNLGIRDMSKWHFSGNSRIIWLFPPCSQDKLILAWFAKKSHKHPYRVLLLLCYIAILMGSPLAFAAAQGGQLIEKIDVSGNRRIPTETVKARVYSREGDIYDEAALERDLRSIWASGYFEDVRM